jgi:hypothetical protein
MSSFSIFIACIYLIGLSQEEIKFLEEIKSTIKNKVYIDYILDIPVKKYIKLSIL